MVQSTYGRQREGKNNDNISKLHLTNSLLPPQKSVSALSATKRDLAEFVSVVSNDTSVAVKNASDNIKGLMQHETVSLTPIFLNVRLK